MFGAAGAAAIEGSTAGAAGDSVPLAGATGAGGDIGAAPTCAIGVGAGWTDPPFCIPVSAGATVGDCECCPTAGCELARLLGGARTLEGSDWTGSGLTGIRICCGAPGDTGAAHTNSSVSIVESTERTFNCATECWQRIEQLSIEPVAECRQLLLLSE